MAGKVRPAATVYCVFISTRAARTCTLDCSTVVGAMNATAAAVMRVYSIVGKPSEEISDCVDDLCGLLLMNRYACFTHSHRLAYRSQNHLCRLCVGRGGLNEA